MAVRVQAKIDATPGQPIQTYYIAGNYPVIQAALRESAEEGAFPVSDSDFPYIAKQTTRGENIHVLEVGLQIIEGLWLRHRHGESELKFTAYQLLDNGLIRPLEERTLRNDTPVQKARKTIGKKIPHRWSATAARR